VKPKRIGFLAYEGIVALDLVGPMDAFSNALDAVPKAYELVVIGMTEGDIKTKSGMVIRPHCSLSDCGQLDTLIIPGGPGSRSPSVCEAVSPWIKGIAPRVRRLASVCTGIYLLATTGLLDGRRVTTHWNYSADVARRFPALDVDPDAIYLKSDKFYTSAGITAGIDLALAMIEEDLGSSVALKVARGLVVYLKRTGGQRQYSSALRLQAESNGRLSDLASWMTKNLHRDLSVSVLAAHSNLSRRQFTRVFTETFGAPPSSVVLELRLDQARALLLEAHASVEGVASAVGFGSADSFRRAFSRRYGVSPSAYRVPFQAG